MLKEDIKPNDIVIFKNGARTTIDMQTEWIIDEFYDDDLRCLKSDDFTIVKVLRPYYAEIYDRNNRTALELKSEIIRIYERNKR